MLTLDEHNSSSYGPRTWHNAKSADLTIALAVDYATYGEMLTHKAAGENYLALPFENLWLENARLLYKELHRKNVACLNIAGNGIYTLDQHGYSQMDVNQYVYSILRQAYEHYPVQKIVTGGQTGVDIAGAIAGVKLGIATVVTFPKGYRQRDKYKRDADHTQDEIRKQIEDGVAVLQSP